MKTALLTILLCSSTLCAETLGIRNNNPGNLVYSKHNDWKGQVGKEKGFVKFSSPKYGIRAMAILLKKRIKEGRTLEEAIAIWAPPHENDTEKYIRFVSLQTGIRRDQKFSQKDLTKIIIAVIKRENSKNPYPDELISEAIRMA